MLDILAAMGDLDQMPELLRSAFPGPISFQEERMLQSLDQELQLRVGMMLDSALDGEVLIQVSEADRRNIREMNAVRRVLREILLHKGMAAEVAQSFN